MPDPIEMTPDAILSHMDWVRRLARRLVRDPNLAEDLSQTTFVTALSQPPVHQDRIRGWLAKVLENAFRQTQRSAARHERLQSSVPRPRETPRPDEIVSRAQALQSVAEAAIELPEHYRTVVLLRYFEDLTPTEIASYLEIPLATVKSRLSRALQALRNALDDRFDQDRKAWLVALASLHPAVTTATFNTKLLIATGILLAAPTAGALLLASDFTIKGTGTAESTPPNVAAAAPATSPGIEARRPEADRAILDREAVHRPAPSRQTIGDPGDTRGIVLDADGHPRQGVAIELEGTGEASSGAVSDPAGEFAVPRIERVATLRAAAPSIVTIVAAVLNPKAPLGRAGVPVMVVADRVELHGEVVTHDGSPLSGVRVEYLLPRDFRSRFVHVPDYALIHRWDVVSTDASGRFRMSESAVIRDANLRFVKPGFLPTIVPVPCREKANTVPELRIVMRRPSASDGIVTGIVTAHDGYPAAGALVIMGHARATSDARGRFSVSSELCRPGREAFALKRGFQPGRLTVPKLTRGLFLHLHLGEPALSIRGQILDEFGEPKSNVFVWPIDPMVYASRNGRALTAEAWLGETRHASWGYVLSDEQGRFRLEGLIDRPYRLTVMDSSSLRARDVGPFTAGMSDIRIEFNSDGISERVAGRVIDRRGNPMPGVAVMACRDVIEFDIGAGHTDSIRNGSQAVYTDDDGRFQFDSIAASGVYLNLSGNGIMTKNFGRGQGFAFVDHKRASADLEIVVDLKMELAVRAPTSFADSFCVHDVDNKPVQMLHVVWKNALRDGTRFPIRDGRTMPISVPDTATTVVYFKADLEVGRRRLDLIAGQLNFIDL